MVESEKTGISELDNAYRSWEEALDGLSPRWPPGFRCPDGCCECCMVTPSVPITALEALRIAKALGKLPEEARGRLTRAIRERARRLASGDKLRGVPCAFLNGNLCEIYADRPLFCRAYGFAAEEDGAYFGCEVLLPELRLMQTVELPSLSAAKEAMPRGNVAGLDGTEIPEMGPMIELLDRLLI